MFNYKDGVFYAPLGKVKIPSQIRLSMTRLNPEGVYIIENGMNMMLWIGRQTPQGLLMSIFGVDKVESIDISMVNKY